jgi:hypothetical protein
MKLASFMAVTILSPWSGHAVSPSPVSAEVTPLTLRPRTRAPASIELKLHSQSRAPLDGSLLLQVSDRGTTLYHQQIPDLTLTFGETSQRVLLPPPPKSRVVQEVRVVFATRDRHFELGNFPLTGEWMKDRQYTIGICRPAFGGSEGQQRAWRALRPDRLFLDENSRENPVQSSPVWFAPEDLPSSLGLCVFDVILLEGQALAALADKQLADVSQWVKAGGSLCIVAPIDLKAPHLDFLNELLAAGPGAHAFTLAEGKLARETASPKSSENEDSPVSSHAGLGRVVIALRGPETEEEVLQWKWLMVTQFLGHSNLRKSVLRPDEQRGQRPHRNVDGEIRTQLLDALPSSARAVPIPLVAGILGLFILLVGPGEWIVLGRLRRRRWTWVTFPALALGCTWTTIRTAEHFLGMADQTATMVITDYAPEGTPLRENRFKVWFAGKNKAATSEWRQSLAVLCGNVGNSQSDDEVSKAGYEGRLPGHFTLRFPVAQWSPSLERSMTFSPAAHQPSLHWEKVSLQTDFATEKDAPRTVSQKIGAAGWTVHVYVGERWIGDDPPFRGSKPRNLAEMPWHQQLCVEERLPWGTTISPSCSADLTDLLLDHGPDDRVVMAERRVGNEIEVQRCIYRPHSHE